MTYSRIVARDLRAPQRDLLISHLDKPARPVIRTGAGASEGLPREVLIRRRLLRFVTETGHPRPSDAPGRGKFTALTDAGRDVLCALLSDMIDVLVLAQVVDLSAIRSFDAAGVNPALTKPAHLALHEASP